VLQGEGPVEGRWVDQVVRLEGVRGGHCDDANSGRQRRLELTKFHSASNQGDNRHARANTPGIRHVAFAVEDIDAVVAGLRARGALLRPRSGWNHDRASRGRSANGSSPLPILRGSSRGSDSPAGRTRRALTCLTDPDQECTSRSPVLLRYSSLDAAPARPNANITIRLRGFVVTPSTFKPVSRAQTADICRPMYPRLILRIRC
jgi:hypothetical protein